MIRSLVLVVGGSAVEKFNGGFRETFERIALETGDSSLGLCSITHFDTAVERIRIREAHIKAIYFVDAEPLDYREYRDGCKAIANAIIDVPVIGYGESTLSFLDRYFEPYKIDLVYAGFAPFLRRALGLLPPASTAA